MRTKKTKFRVPKKVYDDMIDVFGTRETAEDAVSLYLDRMVRRKFSRLTQDADQEMHLYMYDEFFEKFMYFVKNDGLTLDEYMSKVIKKLCQRKKLRSDILELVPINKQNEEQV